MCVCVCVCVCKEREREKERETSAVKDTECISGTGLNPYSNKCS